MNQLDELKRAARATWAAGDYDTFLRQERFCIISQLPDRLGLHERPLVCDQRLECRGDRLRHTRRSPTSR
jgi:hypothetical protein